MKQLLAIAAGVAATAAAPSHHWSYSGAEGPSHWAELDKEFVACGAGKSQSPIDISTKTVHAAALPPLDFNYKTSALHIVDNGHTVQVSADPGSFLKVGNHRYELVQLHFHHPSEERLNGKSFEMEAHLVHRDAKGKLAVVAVLIDPGQQNEVIETLWKHLPKAKEAEESPAGVRFDPAALIPPSHSYFTYMGSLTTPPCAEGVRWIVLKSPRTLSKLEIATFASLYPNDARPVQKLNGREVLATR